MSETLELVSHSHTPMMVLQVPSQVITAASPSAVELLDPVGQPLIGRTLTDFIEGDPSGAMPLLAAGRLAGYEALRVLKLTGQRRRLWISAVPDTGPTQLAIAVLLKEDATSRAFLPWKDDDPSSPVIGSTDAQLMVDRVSSEAHASLGRHVEQVIGTSFLSLFTQRDIAEVLLALAQTSKSDEGVTLRVGVVGASLAPMPCQLVLLPLTPAPSCAFALLRENSHGPADGRAVADLITRLSTGIRGATSQAVASGPVRSDFDLSQLSSRELEIVTRLMTGDRVPAIAKQLFLSEDTVKSHIRNIMSKLSANDRTHAVTIALKRGIIDV
jgi:DNA-binding CsgD family transcriptional regulator